MLLTGRALCREPADDTVTVFTPSLQSPLTVPVADQPIGLVETGRRHLGGLGQRHADAARSHDARRGHHARDRRSPTALAVDFPAGRPGEALLVADAAARCASSRRPVTSSAPSPTGAAAGRDRRRRPQSRRTRVGLDRRRPGTTPAAGPVDEPRRPVRRLLVGGDQPGGRRHQRPASTSSCAIACCGGRRGSACPRRAARRSGALATPVGLVPPALSADGRYVLFLSLGDDAGRRRRQRPRGPVPPRSRRRRRRPVRRAGPDLDPPRLGAERRLGGHVPPPVAGACITPHIEAALSRDGRQVAFSTAPRVRPRPTSTACPTSTCTTSPAAARRGLSLRPGGVPGAGRGGHAGPQRQRPHRRVPHLGPRHGVLRHQRRRRRLRGRSRSRRQRRLRRAVADLHPHQPAARRRAVHDAVLAGRDQRRRPLGRLRVAVRRWPSSIASTGHNSLVRDRSRCRSSAPASSRPTRAISRTWGSAPASTFIRIDRDVDADGILDEAGTVDVRPVRARSAGRGRAPATDAAARLVVVGRAGFVDGLAVRDLLGPGAAAVRHATPTAWPTASRPASA